MAFRYLLAEGALIEADGQNAEGGGATHRLGEARTYQMEEGPL